MAAPFGFSVTDLIQVIELTRKIYLNCFTEEQGAHNNYRQFVSDIESFGNSLERLKDVVQEAQAQSRCHKWNLEGRLSDGAEDPWPQLIKDFHETLEQCHALLARHGYLQNGRRNPYLNFRWGLAEREANVLREDLKRHVTKVEFYVKYIELASILKNGNELQGLTRRMAMMVPSAGLSPALLANVLTAELRERFEANLASKRPSWLQEGSDWPLREGFEAFSHHFARSTFTFTPPPRQGNIPDSLRFLNLAQSAWILTQLRESSLFASVGIDSIWNDRMRASEDVLRSQLHRFESGELGRPSTQELVGFREDFYAISSGEERSSDPLDVTVPGPLEEKIMEVGLSSDAGDRESALLIFRESETDFRLVTSTKQADSLGAQHDTEVEACMDRHRLVPAYSVPGQGPSCRHNLLLFNEKKGKKPKEFVFRDAQDVRRLQRALTGYRVHHDMPIAHWCVNSSTSPEPLSGFVQLWQYKPLLAVQESEAAPQTHASPCIAGRPLLGSQWSSRRTSGAQRAGSDVGWNGFPDTSPAEASSRNPLNQLFWAQVEAPVQNGSHRQTSFSSLGTGDCHQGRPISKVSSLSAKSDGSSHGRQASVATVSGATLRSKGSVISPVQGPRGGGIEFCKPEPPVLIILTIRNRRYSILHLTLDEGLHVNPRACGCRKPELRCQRVVLERAGNRSFCVRTLIAEEEGARGIESWDLSAFRHPRSEKWEKTTVVDKVKTLELVFKNDTEKKEFLHELKLLENVRTADQNDYTTKLREKKKKARA